MSESEVIGHGPCPACGSRDNVAQYDDGHEHCFTPGCTHHTRGAGDAPTPTRRHDPLPELLIGEHVSIKSRKLEEDTCRKFDYMVGINRGKPVHIATYHDPETGQPVAQKVRTQDKDFYWVGEPKRAGLYGQHLWNGGRRLVVTEGEIDCLSVSQVQGNKWPTVSLPNGAQGAVKDLSKAIEFLDLFEEVVLMFDNDEHGRLAAQEVSEMLKPGQCRVASLPRKDPSECLMAGEPDAITSAMWQAAVLRPDGILNGADMWDQVSEVPEMGLAYPWECLDKALYGQRTGEIVTWCSGSGMGKSQICRELFHHLHRSGIPIGLIALEEDARHTGLGIMSVQANMPLHLPDHRDKCGEAEFKLAYEATLGSGNIWLYDHHGTLDSDEIASKIRYMVRACGVKAILLDHISIMVSGQEDGDERRIFDNTMTRLRSLAGELDVIFHLVSHLKTAPGTPHEEGGLTSLSQLRGSRSIGQISNIVVGLERDQQDPKIKHITTLRVLKNRFAGTTGVAGYLSYDPETGRMSQCDEPGDDEENPFDGTNDPF
jgi:twinkle protein